MSQIWLILLFAPLPFLLGLIGSYEHTLRHRIPRNERMRVTGDQTKGALPILGIWVAILGFVLLRQDNAGGWLRHLTSLGTVLVFNLPLFAIANGQRHVLADCGLMHEAEQKRHFLNAAKVFVMFAAALGVVTLAAQSEVFSQ